MIEGYPCGLKRDCSKINAGTGTSLGPVLIGKIWFSDLGTYLYRVRPYTNAIATRPMAAMYIACSPQGPHRPYAALGMGMGQRGFEKLMKAVVKLG